VRSQTDAPGRVQLQGSRLARWVLGLFGWTVRFDGLPALQGVMVVYPHTSNWDFIVAILAKWAVGLQLKFWGKDTLFQVPVFGRWMRWVGGVPVRRSAPQGVVTQVVDSIAQARAAQRLFWLGLSPEGTRQRTPGWRSGFYQVALRGQLPLGVVRLDYRKRVVDATAFIDLSGDAQADLARIAELLDGTLGKNPALASPIQLVPARSASAEIGSP
jgi:1-acyl-sn-glycerol-3-phosphate acyltransferase